MKEALSLEYKRTTLYPFEDLSILTTGFLAHCYRCSSVSLLTPARVMGISPDLT